MTRGNNPKTSSSTLAPEDTEPSWDASDAGRFPFAISIPAWIESNSDWIWVLTWLRYGYIIHKGGH